MREKVAKVPIGGSEYHEPRLDRHDVAEILQKSIFTVERLAKEGSLAFYRIRGRSLRFSRADVDSYLWSIRSPAKHEAGHDGRTA